MLNGTSISVLWGLSVSDFFMSIVRRVSQRQLRSTVGGNDGLCS